MKTNAIVLASAMAVFLASTTWADMVTIYSQPTSVNSNETVNAGAPQFAVVPYGAYEAPVTGAYWVSFTPNVDGALTNSETSPAGVFVDSFSLSRRVISGGVTVWADDTASVYLDGVQKFAADFTDSNGPCQLGIIGCLPKYGGFVNLAGLAAGSHTLEVNAYQTGGGGFGVLYQGSVDTPEPSILLILGLQTLLVLSLSLL